MKKQEAEYLSRTVRELEFLLSYARPLAKEIEAICDFLNIELVDVRPTAGHKKAIRRGNGRASWPNTSQEE